MGVNYNETVIPPGVATRNVRGPILFKCCRVNYNEETKRLEIPPGEYIGKITNRSEGDDEENAIGDEVDTDETDLPGRSLKIGSPPCVIRLNLSVVLLRQRHHLSCR